MPTKKPKLSLLALEDRTTPTTLPGGFNEQVVVSGILNPTSMTLTPDGRIFVTEQDGTIRIVQNDTLLPEPLIKIDTLSGGEGGLVGLALDPNFASNGYFYAYYLVPSINGKPEFNRVSRFTADGNQAKLSTEKILLDMDPIVAPAGSYTHNGGAMHFGIDGKLYIATGDNVDGPSSQSLSQLRGKILRLNPDGSIPADNPTSFQGVSGTTSGKYRAIYALGFRNPFTFGVNPVNGAIYVNDVGQDTWEEIDQLQAGRNYGWPVTEGVSDNPNYTNPIYTYKHGLGDNNGLAITAGTFYTGGDNTFDGNLVGDYFFADFVSNWIKSYDPTTGAVTMFAKDLTKGGVIDLDVNMSGDLLYLARGDDGTDSSLYRITRSNAPAISRQPGGRRLAVGESVTLSVIANGAGPLRYQWTRNGFNINGATDRTLTVRATVADDQASYRVVVSNDFGSISSGAAVLTVTQSKPPVATIVSPRATDLFAAGEVITALGTGFDPDTGTLPGSALKWKVDYFTGTASRPFVNDTTGDSITFTVPKITPYTLPDVYYKITLTVTDTSGATSTITRDIRPRTAVVTIGASVPGVDVTLDGQPMGQIHTFTGVAGLQRQIAVPATATLDGQLLPFIGWSDGDTNPNRVIDTPYETTTLLAVYKRATKSAPVIATGAAEGNGPLVKTFDVQGRLQSQFFAFNANDRGGVTVASEDFNGDGVADVAAGAGPGATPVVRIFDGATGLTLESFTVYEPEFTGGVSVDAADFTGDGVPELVVTPGFGGGPRVRILDARTGATIADFYGIADDAFRGGARASAGDVNGDGTPDLVVSAGEGGGPRVAGWDGKKLASNAYERLFADFFAFDSSLRGGAFVSLGELDGDNYADIVMGAGIGGGPEVRVRSGAQSNGEQAAQMSSFFADAEFIRDGVKVLARDLDGDGKSEIITASGVNGNAPVSVFDARGARIAGFNAFDELIPRGVSVG